MCEVDSKYEIKLGLFFASANFTKRRIWKNILTVQEINSLEFCSSCFLRSEERRVEVIGKYDSHPCAVCTHYCHNRIVNEPKFSWTIHSRGSQKVNNRKLS